VSYLDGAKFCQENSKKIFYIKDLMHFECSAVTGENIDNIFHSISKSVITKVDEGIIELDDDRKLREKIIDLDIPPEEPKKGICQSC